MKYPVLLCLLLPVVLTSCFFGGERVRGNGVIKTETRSVGAFSRVEVSGNIELHITQGPAADIRIETDENLLPLIEVRTSGDELEISPRNNFNLDPSGKIKVYVSAPEFKKLGASGACQIYSDSKIASADRLEIDLSGASHARLELNALAVKAELSGAGSIDLRGETKELDIDGSGSSDIRCMGLMAENVDVDISGAGDAEVFASVKLDVHVSGAGDVRYKGNAAVNQNISGAGSVRKVD